MSTKQDERLEFLQDNEEAILADSAGMYDEVGRGLWIVFPAHVPTGPAYIAQDSLSEMPDYPEGVRADAERMVAAYDPDTQAVVVMVDTESQSVHLYTIGEA